MPKKSLYDFKKRIRGSYDKIGKVYCPVLKEDVYFNAQGFHHLLYDTVGRARTVKEQLYKLHQAEHIEEVVENAGVVDELRLAKVPINRKRKAGKRIIKEVTFSSIIGYATSSPKRKVKVICRKVGNGKTIFWSVMKLRK